MPRRKATPAPTPVQDHPLDQLVAAINDFRDQDVIGLIGPDGARGSTVLQRLATLQPLVASCLARGIEVSEGLLAHLPSIDEIANEYHRLHTVKKDAETGVETLRAAVLEYLDRPEGDGSGTLAIPNAPDLRLVRIPKGGRETLNKGKLQVALVEQGLDPKVVANVLEQATDYGVPYFELRVLPAKDAA